MSRLVSANADQTQMPKQESRTGDGPTTLRFPKPSHLQPLPYKVKKKVSEEEEEDEEDYVEQRRTMFGGPQPGSSDHDIPGEA